MIESMELSPASPVAALAAESSGDERFLSALPPALEELGREFLLAVRRICDGQLDFAPKIGMFVNRPNNAWTVSIRPRKSLLAVTIYGLPAMYAESDFGFTLQVCRSRYSWFEVASLDQVSNATALIAKAMNLKNGRSRRSSWNT